jgi:hypothetical protein
MYPDAPVQRAAGDFIESMHNFERVRMSALERVELVTKQDVGFGNVGIEQSESRSVCRIVERVVHKLVLRRDARSTADQRYVLKFLR